MAVNFSGMSRKGLVGRVLRLPLALIPRNARVPILQGPLRGRWWVAGSMTHGAWLGSYEMEKQTLFNQEIRPGHVVYDIGANVGYYTMLAAQLAGPTGKVFAFEPLPRNLGYLRRHVEMNKLTTATVVDAAVSEKAGEAFFGNDPGESHTMAHLREQGGVKVRLVSVDGFVAAGNPRPTLLKIDVEGAEASVLRGARGVLTSSPRPVIFLATHGAAVHAECLGLLKEMGYTVTSADDRPLERTDEVVAR